MNGATDCSGDTLEAVPLGQEAAAMDIDAEIEKITRSCAG